MCTILSFFLYLLTKCYIQMYCHVQREQDNKAQITGTNSCPVTLSSTHFNLDILKIHFTSAKVMVLPFLTCLLETQKVVDEFCNDVV